MQFFGEHKFLFHSGTKPRSEITDLYGMLTFSLLRTAFQSGHTFLHYHQQCMRVKFAPYLWQHLTLLFVFIFIYLLAF